MSVCGTGENVKHDFNFVFSLVFSRMYWEKGFTIQHWAKTVILVTLMCVTTAGAWVIIHVYVDPIVRILTAGSAVIIGYVCIKMLGENTMSAYQRAKVSSIDIVATSPTDSLNTICQDFGSSSSSGSSGGGIGRL